MLYIPAQRDNRPEEYRLLMQGMQQFGQGLGAIGQAKQGQSDQLFKSLLGDAMKTGNQEAINALISQPPQAGPMGPTQSRLFDQQADYATDPTAQARTAYYKGRTGAGSNKEDEEKENFARAKQITGFVSQLQKQKEPMVDEYTKQPLQDMGAAVASIDKQIKHFQDQIPGLTGTEVTDEERFEGESQRLEQERQEGDQSYHPVEITQRTADATQQKQTLARIQEMSDTEVITALQNILPNLEQEKQEALQRGLIENDPEKLRNALEGLVQPLE